VRLAPKARVGVMILCGY